MGYLNAAALEMSDKKTLAVDIGSKKIPISLVEMPFYRHDYYPKQK